jgi:hypothetical protein
MKKTLIFLLFLICFLASTVLAQIPNPGFENWTAGDPDGWATSNAFPISLINIVRTTDCYSGSYALRGDVVDFYGSPVSPVIQSGSGGTGFTVSEQYHSLDLYYKFTPVGGDKFYVNVSLEKNSNLIAQGAVAPPSGVTAYTHLLVPLDYTVNDVPDLAIIQISIIGPVTGSDYHTGSVIFVDDLSFSMSSGIAPGPGISPIECYPNPASDVIYIRSDKVISGNIILKIFNSGGKEMKEIEGTAGSHATGEYRFPVRDLLSGVYFFSMETAGRSYHGKFMISR